MREKSCPWQRRLIVVAAGAGLMLACGSTGGPPTEAPVLEDAVPRSSMLGDGFDPAEAMAHLENLVDFGPRVMGSAGAAAARSYVRAHLEGLGLEVEERSRPVGLTDSDPVDLVNLAVLIPGTAPDPIGEIVVVTPLDTAPRDTFELLGANEGGSGSATVLELARALARSPLPYPTRLVFLDGEVFEDGLRLGIQVAAFELQGHDVRLLLYLHQVGDADLEIRRDLVSHRVFRDSFFRTAARLGHGEAFAAQKGFDQIPGGHELLFRNGFRQIVALSDIRYGGSETPGDFWRTAEDNLDHVSSESLGVVGETVLEGLKDIGAHLRRVDAHSQVTRPADEPEPGEPETQPSDVAPVDSPGDSDALEADATE
jgi:hypothetical protein